VTLEDDVVINEVFYNGPGFPAADEEFVNSTFIEDSDRWKYDATDTPLSPSWTELNFPDGGWPEGPAPLGSPSVGSGYANTVLNDSPLAYWRLGDAGGTAIDATGNGHNGTIDAGVVRGLPGLIGDASDAAIRVVGSQRITVPRFQKYPAGSTGYSVEYWLNVNSTSGAHHNIVGDGEGSFYLMNYLSNNNPPNAGVIRPHINTNVGCCSIDGSTPLTNGVTYHVVTTWDQASGDMRIWATPSTNSNIVLNGSGNKFPGGTPISSNFTVYIGDDNREGGGDFVIDEAAIYNYPLTQAQVQAHFDASSSLAFNTPLTPGPDTVYFRKKFNFSGDPQQTELLLRTSVDDGAVFYMNGSEVYRHNMPSGAVSHTTLAFGEVDRAVPTTVTIPSNYLQNGDNVLAVEVHQASRPDPDIAFSAQLTAVETLSSTHPFLASDEEWNELYNRGTSMIDLGGWSLDDAVRLTIPQGTMLDRGEYLVIAKDPVAMQTQYPALTTLLPVGFAGRLGNGNDRILLLDVRGNPADEVHYFDGGRWPEFADAGGSSLELRDPDADNSRAEAWAASNELNRSAWQSISYRADASNTPSSAPSLYNELIVGLLDAGVVLLDDIRVIQDPDGANRQLIQNGTFSSGNANAWRIIGNHHASVVPDPDNDTNPVLRLETTGPAEHMHNHAETTLKDGGSFVSIQNGQTYEVSFRARWMGGSNQLNTRLYFNRVHQTTRLDIPEQHGTPGEVNSTVEANLGPTYHGFSHSPVVPASGQGIEVSVVAEDPDDVASMRVWYSVNGGGWTSRTMNHLGSGRFTRQIPSQSSGRVIQFYVEGTDENGATSTYPARGRESRALIKVDDGIRPSTAVHHFEIIMTPSDSSLLGTNTNYMSNDRLGTTVVYEGEAFYDVGVRLKGSQRGRPTAQRRSFAVRFHPDHLLRGVHETVSLDRSGGWRFGTTFGQDEILIHQFFNHAGGIPSLYNDLVFVEAPTVSAGTAILQLARYNDIYLDSQFEDGADGTAFEYELIYYPTTTSGGPEGLKRPSPDRVAGVSIRNMGDDKEVYRYNFIIENNRRRDDYSPIIELAKAFSLSGAAFHERTNELLDVDQWLRAFAGGSLAVSCF